MRIIKTLIFRILKLLGYSIHKIYPKRLGSYIDIADNEFWDIYFSCKDYTMTSPERMYALYCSVNNILLNNIKGDFVECGVWRGGSAMLIAKILVKKGIQDRKIFLYDTFEGMSKPTSQDIDLNGSTADYLLKKNILNKTTSVWCLADINDVRANLLSTDFPKENTIYIQGKVENTIPDKLPSGKIALLRLDTDWYESTYHELVNLYPILSENGILIIDDYGHWEGCRKAVDRYFTENNINLLLHRIDYTGRIATKTN